jgi:hypothetical protein
MGKIANMELTLNLPESLVLHLKEKATDSHLSLEDVVTQTLEEHVANEELALMDKVLEKNDELMTRLS